ncbi:MAG: DUF6430 domain-containing protein [Bacteroidales bacterium]|nr:DUF6430 domain-containing protein [Bacteroidales bacterium]
MIIKLGDLFDQDCIIVIPVNDYLDTPNNNVIISKRYVHGKFIDYYKDHYPQKNLEVLRNVEIHVPMKKIDFDITRGIQF